MPLSAVQTETAHVSSKLSYASMAKRSNEGKYGHGRRSRGRQLRLEDKSSDGTTKRPESSAGSTVTSATEPNEPAAAAGKRHKIQVIGARRIWGTLSECTVNSVKNVISRICKLENGLHVRRKTKFSPVTNKTKWWFVVHADEGLLSELNTKWDQVKLQTSWKLEPCFMYSDSEGNNRAGAVSPVPLSQDSAQQVHDNEYIVVSEQASNLSAHSVTLSQQPSTQPPVASQQASDLSTHCSSNVQQPLSAPTSPQQSDSGPFLGEH